MAQTLHIHLEEYCARRQDADARSRESKRSFYILDGKGYEIHDGQRYDWKAGDIAVVHNNCVHQHNNGDDHAPARALVIKTKPMFLFMNMLFQKRVTERPKEPTATQGDFQPREDVDYNQPWRPQPDRMITITITTTSMRTPTSTNTSGVARSGGLGCRQRTRLVLRGHGMAASRTRPNGPRVTRDARRSTHPGRHAVGERAARAAQAPSSTTR